MRRRVWLARFYAAGGGAAMFAAFTFAGLRPTGGSWWFLLPVAVMLVGMFFLAAGMSYLTERR